MALRTPARILLGMAALAAAAAMTASAAAPAHAASLGLTCPTATSQPFMPWNDAAFYVPTPGGGGRKKGASSMRRSARPRK